uniref:Uncharacterized protein n=1 Tax=Meloidogyne javanica TaxID=6303 RepID=A0A915M2C7_MELJA
SNKEEDCKLDLDKVAYFKRVCNQFQKENLNDRVELLRLKGFDELDSQTNNLDLEKLKKDLPKIKKQQNPTKGKGKSSSWRKLDATKANSIDIEPPRRSFELDRSGSNIADPARKSFDTVLELIDQDHHQSDETQKQNPELNKSDSFRFATTSGPINLYDNYPYGNRKDFF